MNTPQQQKNPFDLSDSLLTTGMTVIYGDLSRDLSKKYIQIDDAAISECFWLTSSTTSPTSQNFTLKT